MYSIEKSSRFLTTYAEGGETWSIFIRN